ncbi:hypothetical protein MRX96_059102 [Rhipicephalus microplus]
MYHPLEATPGARSVQQETVITASCLHRGACALSVAARARADGQCGRKRGLRPAVTGCATLRLAETPDQRGSPPPQQQRRLNEEREPPKKGEGPRSSSSK